MKTNQILITQDFKTGLGDMLGTIQIADNENAKAVYELLCEHPDWFTFEVAYTINEDGTKELTGISLVSKHVKNAQS